MSVQVVIGVIINKQNQVLITKRAADQHQANKWEFPGGKVEATETAQQALTRELQEELGIKVESASFLLTINHQYQAKKVTLDVFVVRQWLGEPKALEGQPMRWVQKTDLNDYDFPAANAEILSSLLISN